MEQSFAIQGFSRSGVPAKVIDPSTGRIPGLVGVILCGGRSSRMGRPKEWLELGGRTLLQHVAQAVSEAAESIAVVAAADHDPPPVSVDGPIQIVHDSLMDQGPLHGIARGMESLPGQAAAVYVSACDVPLLTPEWIRFLVARLGDNDAVVPRSAGRLHPLAAVYKPSARDTAQRLLAQGERRVTRLFDFHPTVIVEEEELRQVDPELRSLQNVNTLSDFERIVQWFEGWESTA